MEIGTFSGKATHRAKNGKFSGNSQEILGKRWDFSIFDDEGKQRFPPTVETPERVIGTRLFFFPISDQKSSVENQSRMSK